VVTCLGPPVDDLDVEDLEQRELLISASRGELQLEVTISSSTV